MPMAFSTAMAAALTSGWVMSATQPRNKLTLWPEAMRDYAKKRTKELGIAGPGGVRVNKAGCMDRCSEGPIAVVYPEGTWYTYADREDVEEIVTEHLLNGRVVQRLKI